MHPSDADLLALVDGELEPDRAEAVRSHLAGCPACAARGAGIQSLVEQNRVAFASLEAGDPPAATADEIIEIARRRESPSGAASPLLKAASVAFLLAAGALLAAVPGSPVREAALRLVEELRSDAAPGSTPGVPSASGVAVQPAGRLVIAFVTGQREGIIEIVLEPTGMARVEASDPATSFSVASDSIAVDNRGSAASYVVTLPEALPRAEVRVAGATVFRKIAGETRSLRPASDGRFRIPFASIE